MLDWLDLIPNLGVPGVPARFSAGLSGTPANVAGVPGVPEHQRGTPGTPAGTPAQNRNALNYIEKNREHPEHRNIDRSADLPGWAHQLARLDPCQPPEGFCMKRWRTLYSDATWLLRNVEVSAARDGWSDADLFGLWTDKPGWGGIADRLRGARSLVMDADRASWRSWGQVERFNRGAYPHLRPFWETGAQTGALG